MRIRGRIQVDAGFTLVELLIAVMILGVLFSGITAAMIVTLSGLTGRAQTVTDTTGAQLLSAYLVADAQSADYVDPSQLAAGNANSFTCDDGTPTRVLLELRWTDADGSTGTSDVVYKIEPTSASDYRLVRDLYTVPTDSQTCSPTAETVVVPEVSNGNTDTTAVCLPSACDNGATSVGLQVTAFSSDPKSNNYAPYVFNVSGARRTS